MAKIDLFGGTPSTTAASTAPAKSTGGGLDLFADDPSVKPPSPPSNANAVETLGGALKGVGGNLEAGAEKLGMGAAGLVPGVGTGIRAAQEGLSPSDKANLEGGFASALDPLGTGQGSSNPQAVSKMRDLAVATLAKHPVARGFAAAGAELPVMYYEWQLAGGAMSALGEAAELVPGIKPLIQAAKEAIEHPGVKGALDAGKDAAAMARRNAILHTSTTAGVASDIDLLKRAKQGEEVPASAYWKSFLFSFALAAGLGVGGNKLEAYRDTALEPVKRFLKEDPAILQQVNVFRNIAKDISTGNKGVHGGEAVYNVATGKGSPAEQQMVRDALIANPRYMSTGTGQQLLLVTRAAYKPEVIADPLAKADDPVLVSYETPTRDVEHRALHSPADIRALVKQQRQNDIRITRVSGPREKVSAFSSTLTEKGTQPTPTTLVPFDSAEGEKIMSSPYAKIDSHFQGLPKLDPHYPQVISEKLTPAYELEKSTPGVARGEGFTTRPTDPGQVTFMSRLHQRATETPEVQHPSEEFAQFADKLVDGPDGLKKRGFSPVNSGTATFSHAHPWIQPTEGTAQPVVVPATDTRVLATPMVTAEAGESHKIKMSPSAQAEELSKSVDTPLPADMAYPPPPSFFEDVHAVEDPVALALQTSADDPRMTNEAREEIVKVLEPVAAKADPWASIMGPSHPLSDLVKSERIVEKLHQLKGDVPVRESTVEPDGLLIHAHDLGDGTVALTKGGVETVVTQAKASGEIAERAKKLSIDDMKIGATTKGPNALDMLPMESLTERLKMAQGLVNQRPGDPTLQKRVSMLTEAIRKRTGTPTETQAPFVDSGEPPPEVGAEPTKKPFGKPGERGSIAISRIGYSEANEETADLARDYGHGKVYQHRSGKWAVEMRLPSGGTAFTQFHDRESAVAGIVHTANVEARAAEVHASIEHAVTANRLPPIASTHPDALIESIPYLNYAMGIDEGLEEMGKRYPEQPQGAERVADFAGMLKDGIGYLNSLGRWGKVGLAHMRAWLDWNNRLNGESEEAWNQFDKATQGRYHNGQGGRAIEDGTDKEGRAAWEQHLKPILDRAYAAGEKLNADLGSRVSGFYYPHVNDWAEMSRQLAKDDPSWARGRAGRKFMQGLMDNGFGENPQAAFQKFVELGGHVALDDERLVQTMTERSNKIRADRGLAQKSVNEVRESLNYFRNQAVNSAPNLFKERLGSANYTDNPKIAFMTAMRRNNAGLTDRIVYGKDFERYRSIIDHIEKGPGGTIGATKTRILMNAMRGRFESHMGSAMQKLMTADRTMLTAAALQHIPQNFLTAAKHGPIRFAKGMVRLAADLSNPEGRAEMRRFRAIISHTRERYYDGSVDDDPGFTSRVMKAWKWAAKPGEYVLEHTINVGRRLAYETGKDAIQADLKAAAAGNTVRLAKINKLWGGHMTVEGVKQLQGRAMDEFVNRSATRIADETMFRFNPLTTPTAYYDSPNMRFLLQFHSYLYSYSRLIGTELFGDTTLKGLATEAVRDPARMMRRGRMAIALLGAMPVYSYARAVLMNSLGAGNQTTNHMVKSMNHLYSSDRRFKDAVDAEIASMSMSHGFGLATGIIQGTLTDNKERVGASIISESLPGAAFIANLLFIPIHTGEAIYNRAVGAEAMTRYRQAKAVEDLGANFGMPGRVAAHAVTGVPRRPRP